MPANLGLDDSLVEEARALGGHETKEEAVTAALQEYVARRKQIGILDLFGTVDYEPEHSHKSKRQKHNEGRRAKTPCL